MRLATVQFGSVLQARHHFASGGEETFRGQRYSVEVADAMEAKADAALYLTLAAPDSFEKREGKAVHIDIVDAYQGAGRARLLMELKDFAPTHMIVRAPFLPALEWGLDNGVKVLPALADSFGGYPLRPKALLTWVRTRRFVSLTRRAAIDLVLNHNYSASRNLAAIGVPAEKIAAYDWPSDKDLSAFPAKHRRQDGPFKVLYAGSLSDAKGVGDAAEAMAASAWLRKNAILELVGRGEGETFAAKTRELGGQARFLGAMPNTEVLNRMADADLVIVPSRHSYAEGLPGTITEALTVRTPLLLSDHPMFTEALGGEAGVRFFPAQNPAAMAQAIEAVLRDPEGYRVLSEQAHAALERTTCTTSWGELIDRWLFGDHDGYLAAAKGKLEA